MLLQTILEGLWLGALLVAVCAVGIRKGAVGMAHLYDSKVQERCVALGLTTKEKINETAIAEGRCAVLQGSVADMIFADDWFDAVTAFETVYFWPDLPQCFREVCRVLKPDGTFLICNESSGDTDKDEKWTEIIGGMTIYSGDELKTFLENAGFCNVQIHKNKMGWLCVTGQKREE